MCCYIIPALLWFLSPEDGSFPGYLLLTCPSWPIFLLHIYIHSHHYFLFPFIKSFSVHFLWPIFWLHPFNLHLLIQESYVTFSKQFSDYIKHEMYFKKTNSHCIIYLVSFFQVLKLYLHVKKLCIPIIKIIWTKKMALWSNCILHPAGHLGPSWIFFCISPPPTQLFLSPTCKFFSLPASQTDRWVGEAGEAFLVSSSDSLMWKGQHSHLNLIQPLCILQS